jgi:hypothetical protein
MKATSFDGGFSSARKLPLSDLVNIFASAASFLKAFLSFLNYYGAGFSLELAPKIYG